MDSGLLLAQIGEVPSLWEMFKSVFRIIWWFYSTSFYWAPVVLPIVFWRVWMRYIRARFISEQEYVLLELRLPQEITKSPVAMQAVLDGMWARGGETTFIDRLWLGKVRLWYSFELVSNEGQVHLYVWARKAFQRFVERSFYAHYPDVEVIPVEDYALAFPFSLESHNLYGIDYRLTGPTGLPIKTYKEYSLDSTQADEDQKIDPMAHLLEFAGVMGKGEHLWMQILCRAHRVEDITFGDYYSKDDYSTIARKEIDRIRHNPEDTVVFPDGGSGKVVSEEQKQRIKAIQQNVLGSFAWDVGIRVLYIGEHEHFDGPTIPGMQGLWQPFASPGYNGIGPNSSRWQNLIDYPWQDFNGMRENRMKLRIVDAYRRRSWFHAPYRYKPSIMTSEELATLFHMPGSVAKTPSIQRIESTRASAPANLPV